MLDRSQPKSYIKSLFHAAHSDYRYPDLQSAERGCDTSWQIASTTCPIKTELIICDNSSDIEVEELLNQSFPKEHHIYRVVRNKYNIGLAANILRAFEIASGHWLWILGDDDEALPDAVETILRNCEKADDSLIQQEYCGEDMVPPIDKVTSFTGLQGLANHLNSAWRYSSLLFISTSVFRLDAFTKALATGYYWNYSLAPFIAMLVSVIGDNGTVTVFPKKIINQGPLAGWSNWRLIQGTATLVEIEASRGALSDSIRSIYTQWAGKSWWLSYPAIILRSKELTASYWKAYCFRIAGVVSGPMQWYLIFCGLFLIPLVK